MSGLEIVSIDRPQPNLYFGAADLGLLDWDTVLWRFAAEKSYWVSTVATQNVGTENPAVAPHNMPVWGIWQNDRFLFSTYPQSKKARNLRQTPRASVHLGNTEAVVVMECHAQEVTTTESLRDFVDDYNPKYRWNFKVEDVAGGVFALSPHTAFAWSAGEGEGFQNTATRWRFKSDSEPAG